MGRFHGIIGIVLILGIAFLFSNNKKRINLRVIASGMLLQVIIGILVLQVPFMTAMFQKLGHGMQKIEEFAKAGANFVYGGIATVGFDGQAANYTAPGMFVFAFNVVSTIILVTVIVAVLYHLRVMQRIVSIIAKGMNFIMRVSGAESLSNVASAFVGQVEAQVMIRPYLAGMTRSELLASNQLLPQAETAFRAALAGYENGKVDFATLLEAQRQILMAAPGALVIAKIVYPETEESQTMGKVKLDVKSQYSNLIDAVSHGASDGMKIGINVIAMLIGFIALITMIDYLLVSVGHLISPDFDLSLNYIFGKLFTPFAWAMGVPSEDVTNAATLFGQKLTINEFVAFNNLTTKAIPLVTEKGLLIVSIAICGFANFSSVGMQIGGIGELAPTRRADLAQLGMRALLCGTLASYLSACIAGIIIG